MPAKITIDEQIAAVQRERAMRLRVYPRWVTGGKMRPEKAAEEIEHMKAVLEALEELRLARAFQHEVLRGKILYGIPEGGTQIAEGVAFHSAEGAFASLRGAWEAWISPREAPLTQGRRGPG